MGRMKLVAAIAAVLIAIAVSSALYLQHLHRGGGTAGGYTVKVEVYTPAIGADGFFKKQYTCDGVNISPKLIIRLSGSLERAKSLAIVMLDPDAPHGTFIHWILYNVPVRADTITIPEGLPRTPSVPGMGLQGVNDFHIIGYGGPCPPRGDKPHHYIIRVYVLDTILNVPAGINYRDLMKAIKGHVIGKGEVVGLYKR
jgi:Raf kinase inhibitor-like YbhB/YbcL family protein